METNTPREGEDERAERPPSDEDFAHGGAPETSDQLREESPPGTGAPKPSDALDERS